jgi:curli production assembly/transport component CsgF
MKIFAFCSMSALAVMTAFSPAVASQLVYTPISPTFGGNPLNGTFLLGTAQGQGFGAKSGQSAASPDLSGLTSALSGLSGSTGTANPTTINIVTPTVP